MSRMTASLTAAEPATVHVAARDSFGSGAGRRQMKNVTVDFAAPASMNEWHRGRAVTG
jgi:hypothetical protein